MNRSLTFLLITLTLFTSFSFAEELLNIHDVVIPPANQIGPDLPLLNSSVPSSPPANPEVGDSWTWWLWSWDPMPPHFEEAVCTVRGKSDRGYVMVEDSEWLVSIDQDDVDSILVHWEEMSPGPYPTQGIYEIDSISFGTPPDELDNDARIYLMWYNFHINADGFFFFFDEYPEGTYPEYHSNECEVLYLNVASSGGPSGDYMHAVIAHEFQHLIHWKYDDDELSWVNEGLSELAMWLYGYPDNVTSFPSNPDNNLTTWEGAWADYIKTYLWTLYFFEQYGGHPSVYALVHEPLNSMAGYDAILDQFSYTENTEDVFADWVVANYLDDTSVEDGRFGYVGEELPSFYAQSYSTYPVEVSSAVNHWAADYYRLQEPSFSDMEITFDGVDANSFIVRALLIHESAATEVFDMTIDVSTQTGMLEVYNISPSDEIVLVVASGSSSGGPTYSFVAGDALGILGSENYSKLVVTPVQNPFSSAVDIQLVWDTELNSSDVTVDIFDIQGRRVNALTVNSETPGTAVVSWNGEQQSGGPATSGIYYARVSVASESCTVKLILLP